MQKYLEGFGTGFFLKTLEGQMSRYTTQTHGCTLFVRTFIDMVRSPTSYAGLTLKHTNLLLTYPSERSRKTRKTTPKLHSSTVWSRTHSETKRALFCRHADRKHGNCERRLAPNGRRTFVIHIGPRRLRGSQPGCGRTPVAPVLVWGDRGLNSHPDFTEA